MMRLGDYESKSLGKMGTMGKMVLISLLPLILYWRQSGFALVSLALPFLIPHSASITWTA